MFRIHIPSLAETGWQMDAQADAASFPLLSSICGDEKTAFVQPVQARLRASLTGESVRIHGHVHTMIRLTCSRCLKPFEHPIDNDFSATAISGLPDPGDRDATGDIELMPDEMDVISYAGDSIDLREEIAQQVIMALPYKPLCTDACKGLCSRCGVDLNRHACRCDKQDRGSPFDVLKSLTLPSEKG